MYKLNLGFIVLLLLSVVTQCKKETKQSSNDISSSVVAEKKRTMADIVKEIPEGTTIPDGMVWISGGSFTQGAVAQDKEAMGHEKPAHEVAVDGFFMDITEVTNAQYAKFVKETGYVTLAEREIDWEEMKKQLPEGTQKPHDSIFKPGSLTFKKVKTNLPNLYDFSQWWKWTIGANWKQPYGPESSIKGKENHPAVHIAFEDAQAYCKWIGRRLPTEAEWEYAARGNKKNTLYAWGDEVSVLSKQANTWEGEFPKNNTQKDGYEATAPVKTYPPNDFGLYDTAGNVWEWTTDWYNVKYYKELASTDKITFNPNGAKQAYNPTMPYAKEKIIKGGSFLCNSSYCASYRLSSRMGSTMDSSAEHIGFRTVADIKEVTESKE